MMTCIKLSTLIVILQQANGDSPKFRILAPPFVCPKNDDAIIDKPENTIVTVQAEPGSTLKFTWTVRWHSLAAPTQLFTLMLWRSVRALEAKLNGPQTEPFVYVINNTELLPGIDYIFNVTGTSSEEDKGCLKSFHIDNIKGDAKLFIEGRADMFAILLVGGQEVYPDMEYTLEALVTVCSQTQDYYFTWTVRSEDSNKSVNVSYVRGSRLEIPKNTLMPDSNYDVLCQVFKYTNSEFITQASLPFRTLRRDVSVYLNVDVLVISVNKPFNLQAFTNVDYMHIGITFIWECVFDNEPIKIFEIENNTTTVWFPHGLPNLGEYSISVFASVPGQPVAAASARVLATETVLPVLQIESTPRSRNEDTLLRLQADVADIYPECSLTWYFMNEECKSRNTAGPAPCDDIEHGKPVSESKKFNSLEENFLNELTDYSNDSKTATLAGELQAAAGTARLLAECGCSLIYNCTTEGTVHADVNFILNEKPVAGVVMVSPETGTALETVFRVSTLAHLDPHGPLRYTFYCELGANETLTLGSYLEHFATETLLPYTDGVTTVRVRVCDSLGACADGEPNAIEVSPGDARTLHILVDEARAHTRRCEMMILHRLAVSAIITYSNAGQREALTMFSLAMYEMLENLGEDCIAMYQEQYLSLIQWFEEHDVDNNQK